MLEVQRYILNQERHHQKVSYLEEFKGLLTKHGVDFDPETFAE